MRRLNQEDVNSGFAVRTIDLAKGKGKALSDL